MEATLIAKAKSMDLIYLNYAAVVYDVLFLVLLLLRWILCDKNSTNKFITQN